MTFILAFLASFVHVVDLMLVVLPYFLFLNVHFYVIQHHVQRIRGFILVMYASVVFFISSVFNSKT